MMPNENRDVVRNKGSTFPQSFSMMIKHIFLQLAETICCHVSHKLPRALVRSMESNAQKQTPALQVRSVPARCRHACECLVPGYGPCCLT